MKIGVIGAGRLGICFALLCEEAGYEVMVSDIRRDYIENLNKKIINTNEPIVNDLLFSSQNLKATISNTDVIKNCDVIYTLVATPSTENGDYDVAAIWQVIEDIKKTEVDLSKKIFVVGSTTNPGDCISFQKSLAPYGVKVFYNPEFIAQGSIINDLRKADMVLIGISNEFESNTVNINFFDDLYQKIQGKYKVAKIKYMSTKAAEIVKLAVNCFLTTKISFANMIGEVVSSSGMNSEIRDVLDAIGTHSPIGTSYLKYGFGYGGPCLPRDNRAFADYASKVGLKHNLGTVTDHINNEHSSFLLKFIIKDNDKKLPFLFDHLSYKKGTDILTESQQLRLCRSLLDQGEQVIINDIDAVINQIREEFLKKYHDRVSFTNDISQIKEKYYLVCL